MKQFDYERFAAIASRMDSDHDGERASALSLATRMLREAGLRWTDVLSTPAPEPAGIDPSDPWAGVFAGFGIKRNAPRREEPTDRPRRPKPSVSGEDIPASVAGTLRVHEERKTRTGEMLVVTVAGDEADYGPLVVFDSKAIADVRRQPEARFAGGVTRSPNKAAGWMPTLRPRLLEPQG